MESDYEIVQDTFPLPSHDLILFANPKSGGNLARAYLSLPYPTYTAILPSKLITVHIFNLQDRLSSKSACEKILSLLEVQEDLKVIVAGGDGSLIWVIDILIQEQIPLSKLYLTVLPFGSGNDLAASLGWGRDPPSDLFDSYILEWCQAIPSSFDFWTITIEVHESGGIGKVNKTQESVSKDLMTDGGHKKLIMKRLMSNYFSIGLDARIGLGFDKHRTTKKCCNRFMYFWEGLKKMCCCVSTAAVSRIIKKVSAPEGTIIDSSQRELALPNDTAVLLALNIRTYGGGDNFVWEKARGLKQRQWERQSSCDRKLELMNFVGKMSLGLEQIKCTQGQGRKIEQSEGPYVMEFNQNDHKSYMQIDGEYFYLQRPKRACIERWEKSDEIKLLIKNKRKS